MRHLTFALALIAGCAGEPKNDADAVLAMYATGVTDARTALDTLSAGIAGATDVTEVGTMQTTYETEMNAALEEIHHALEDIEMCEMSADAMAMTTDAHASTQEIEDAITSFLAEHASHTEVNHCQASVLNHADAVGGALDALDEHHTAWVAAAPVCAEHDM